jgi:hypothetical protein
LLKPSRAYCHFFKKGFLNSQAVRIRVKLLLTIYFLNTVTVDLFQEYLISRKDNIFCIHLRTGGRVIDLDPDYIRIPIIFVDPDPREK